MTLALYGKSRRRQLALILLALVSVGFAVFGGSSQLFQPFDAFADDDSGYAGTSSGDWANDANLIGSNTATFATTDNDGDAQRLGSFGLTIPASSVIDGIEVEVYGYTTGATCQLSASLREEVGTNDNSAAQVQTLPEDVAGPVTYGGPSDLWGETWSIAELADGDFFVDLNTLQSAGCDTTGPGFTDDWFLAYVQVTVYYTEITPIVDLTVSKTATDDSGNGPVTSVSEGSGHDFRWYITVTNNGNQNITFGPQAANNDPARFAARILEDVLPAGPTYTIADTTPNITGGGSGTIGCQIQSSTLICYPGSNNPVLNAGATFTVEVQADAVPGTYTNPAGNCSVNPLANIASEVTGNNACNSSEVEVLNAIDSYADLPPNLDDHQVENIIYGGVCGEADFNFVVDASGSIGSTDFQTIRTALMQFMTDYNTVSGNQGLYSITSYSSTTDPVTTGFDPAPITLNGTTMPYLDARTATANGILAGIANNADRRYPTNPQVPQYMFVITDGAPNVNFTSNTGDSLGAPITWLTAANDAISAADTARNAGYQVIPIYIDVAPPGDSSMSFANDTQRAEWSDLVMTQIGAGAYTTFANFDELAANLFSEAGCGEISLEKTATAPNIAVGGQAEFKIEVKNTTLQAYAGGAKVADTLDPAYSWSITEAAVNGTCSLVVNQLECTVGALSVGASFTVKVGATINTCETPVPNTANLYLDGSVGPEDPDETSQATVTTGDCPQVGTLTVNKLVWDGDSWETSTSTDFDFLADGATDYTYDGPGTKTDVVPGAYTVTETSLTSGYYLVKIGTCEAPVGVTPLGAQSANANVVAGQTTTVCAYNAPIQRATVEKTGAGLYSVDWSITKDVTPGSVNIPSDTGSDTTDYTVTVTKTFTDIAAAGTITITNPNPVAIQVTVTDAGVTLGAPCDSNPVNIPANGQVNCNWSDTFADGAATPVGYTNTATVTTATVSGEEQGGTGVIAFGIRADGSTDSVTVTDDFGGSTTGNFPTGSVSSTTTFNYTGTHTCEGITNWSAVTGEGSTTVGNTASINDTIGSNNSDNASVDVNCQRPKLTVNKVVEGGSAVATDWTMKIDDVAGPTPGSVFAYVPSGVLQTVLESTGPAGYTLTSVVCTDSNDQNVTLSGSGLSRSLTMPAADAEGAVDVVCTFTNTAQAPLVITKAGSGTYVKDNDWTVIKSIVGDDEATVPDDGSHEFDFDIDVTKTVTYDNVQATGTITITNPAGNVSNALITGLSDSTAGTTITICQLNGAGGALSFNPAYELAPNNSIVCQWSTSLLQDQATPPSNFNNTATVTVDDASVVAGGSSNNAAINFSLSGTTGPETVDVTDVFNGADQDPLLADDISTTTNNLPFSKTLTCAELTGSYSSQGLLTGTRTNKARLNGTDFTLDSNEVTVTLNCQRPSLTLVKERAGDGDLANPAADGAWTLIADATGTPNDLAGAEGTAGATKFVPTGTDYTFSESAGDPRYAFTSVICRNAAGAIVYDSTEDPAIFDMPNANVTCTFTNTYVPTTLELNKAINRVLPGTPDDGQFNIEVVGVASASVTDTMASNSTEPFQNSDGGNIDVAVSPGTYTINESLTLGGGGSLDNYTRTLTCREGNDIIPGYNGIELPEAGVEITLALGDNVDCFITNTRKSTTVEIEKSTQDAAGNSILVDVDFPFTSGQVPGFNLNTVNMASSVEGFVRPVGSTFSVTEVLGALDADWNLISATCTGATDTDLDLADVSITVPDGLVVCSFINKQEAAKITIVKNAIPNDDEDFGFTVGFFQEPPLYEFDLDDDSDETLPNTWVSPDPLVPGEYLIDEIIDGPIGPNATWQLDHPVECRDASGALLNDDQQSNSIAAVVLDIEPGDDITCTFVNRGSAELRICKAIFYDGAFVTGGSLPGLAGPTTFTANMDGAAAPDLSATAPLSLTTLTGLTFNGVTIQADCDTATVPAGVNYQYDPEIIGLPSSAWMTPLYLDNAAGPACQYNDGGDGVACDGQVNNVQPGETRTVVVINEWKLASLEVTKIVNWGPVTPDDSQTFNICIVGPSFPDTTDNGITSPDDTANGCQVADFDGGLLSWTNLIPGNYTVVEQPLPDANLWGVSGSGASADAPQGGTGTHTITNTRLSGSLTVTKTIDLNGGDNLNQTFEICIVGPSYPDTSANGITLPDDLVNGCKTVSNVTPVASWPVLDQGSYTVVERFPNGDQDDWDVTINSVVAVIADGVASNDTTVSIVDGETAQATVLNTLKKGQLIIEKRYGADWETAVCEDPAEADIPVMLLDGEELEDGDGCTWPAQGSYPVDPNEDHTITEGQRDGWALIDVQLEGQCGQVLELDVASIIINNLVLGAFGEERDYSSLIPVTVNVPAGESCTVSFLNEPVGDIVIVKYENVPTAGAQDWSFNFNSDGSPVGSTLLNTGANPAGNLVQSTVTTIPDVPVGDYDVAELEGEGQCDINSLASDYQTHALVSDALPLASDLNDPASFVGAGAVEFPVTKGDTTYVAFSNRGCGSVLSGPNLFVRKFESPDGGFAGTEPLEGWTMTITGTGGIATGFEASLPTDDLGVAGFGSVPVGTYTVCETPQATHEVVGSLLNGGNPVAGVCRTGVQVITPEGEDDINVIVDFFNRSHGQLIIRKVVDSGSNTHVFTADVLFEAQDVPFSVNTPSEPISLPSGTHLVSEDGDPDYRYDGWAIAEDRVCPAEPTNAGVVASVDITVGEDTVLCFYNTGLGSVRVEKSTFVDGQPVNERGGWTITVAGCGFFEVAETDNSGVAFFDDVPACANVTVQEDPDSRPGYTPVSGTARVVSVESFQTTVVAFRNDRITEREETPTPGPSNTPTNTPTNTPNPTETFTPTPAESVAGEITPGPTDSGAKATPIAPDTGVGLFGAESGSPLMLLFLALISITTGLALLGIGRRGNRDR